MKRSKRYASVCQPFKIFRQRGKDAIRANTGGDCDINSVSLKALISTRLDWGTCQMTSKRAALAWSAIFACIIAFCALFGGRDCEVPKSGPFHWLLSGHPYVQRFAMSDRRTTCRETFDGNDVIIR